MDKSDVKRDEVKDFNNLTSVVESLPASQYYDPDHFETELNSIWYRNWIYAGRSAEIAEAGDFKSIRIGSQNILLVRDNNGINGFYNTCRHRGSILCTEDKGNLKTQHISCPYHRWTYNLEGALVRTPLLDETPDFDRSKYSLHKVAVHEWCGCLFVNLLADEASPIYPTMDPSYEHLDHWQIQDLKLAHTYTNRLHCNWKLFWENFVECYHCPGIHPELCDMVPIYKRTFVSHRDASDWQEHRDEKDPKYRGGLRTDAKSWTMDGEVQGEVLTGLTEEEISEGYVYIQNLPSVFVVGHPEYVRIVSILPDGPEHTLLKSEWLLSDASLSKPGFDLSKIVDFGMLVLDQDASVCEINQQGIRSIAFENGVLMPQEYEIARFHDWVKGHWQ